MKMSAEELYFRLRDLLASMPDLTGEDDPVAIRERHANRTGRLDFRCGLERDEASVGRVPDAGAGVDQLAERAELRFPDGVVIPHFGWNQIASSSDFFPSGDVYFANSFRATEAPEGWEVATCDHGGPFLAGIRKGKVAAVQFHPEISGVFGAAILKRWAQW
jgi:hypothetical protein